jgi:ribose transport system permease protein
MVQQAARPPRNQGAISGYIRRFFGRNESSAVVAAALLFLVFAVVTDNFLTPYNVFNLSRNVAMFTFVALGQSLVLVVGAMNLSLGAIGALSVVAMGYCTQILGIAPLLSALIGIAIGILCGVLNGLLVVKLKLNAFIITLATSFIYKGLSVGITKGFPYTDIPKSVTFLGRGSFLGISYLFWLALLFMFLMYVMFRFTLVGRQILATGGNVEAARLSGIRTNKVIVLCNALSGFFAAFAGMLYVSRMGSATPQIGIDWLIISFAVAVIGGTSLQGGVFTSLGLICSGIMIALIKNGLVMLNVDIYFEETFLGLVILVSVAVESLRVRLTSRSLS